MKKVNIFEDIEGTEFPAGRRTRVMIGENGAINGDYFCQGYVVIYQGGSVPIHDHVTVETYTILKGRGEMTVDNETEEVKEGDTIYIESGKSHGLVNTGAGEMHMMFVYAPKMVAEHWAQESSGELK
ncbi:cupin domain-containing protein [Clostridium sp. Marseille-P2415]|uniref:cupin domain-containing protein n=1 Tax=Clostridium sp. Marseille-P2415 TaxID=1805471 RepID=UPI00098875EA|nr:cupin domain-containing protein [Clostridium sp. Marseille-P2415]